MADFPLIDFGPYTWAVLDKDYIVKWNGKLVALNELQANIAAFGQAVEADKQAAVDSAQLASDKAQQTGQDALSTAADLVQTGQDRVATAEDRVATGQDRSAAQGAANTAVQKAQETGFDRTQTGLDRTAAAGSAQAAGISESNATAALADFLKRYLGPHEVAPTTDNDDGPLLVGALYLSTAENDEGMRYWTGTAWVNSYATIDSLSWSKITDRPALAPAEHSHGMSHITGLGEALSNKRNQNDTSFTTYDVTSGTATTTLFLSLRQVFRISATTARTLSFNSPPGAGRAMTVVIHITGTAPITWPAEITWDEGTAPELLGFTRVLLIWDGVQWTGNARSRA